MKSCYWPIALLPGMTATYEKQLAQVGITTTEELLRYGDPEATKALALRLRLHLHHVRRWLVLADLARLPSVGCQYCGLLLHGGVISSVQLTQSLPHQLHRHLLRFQVATLQRRDLCPSIALVQRWIEEARLVGPC